MGIVGNTTNELQATSPGKVAVKTTNTEILKENTARNGLEVVNAGGNAVYLNFGKAATIETGLMLGASGGSWDGHLGGLVWRGSIFGIAPGGEVNITVTEV